MIYDLKSNHKVERNFKININQKLYTKIFDKFKRKIRSGQTYQIKICTKYKNKSQIDPLDFFCSITKTNHAPEAFMIKDQNYSIISCSPETLINKHRSSISTKGINKELMLHSYQIRFMINNKKYTYKALLPDYFQNLLKIKRLNFSNL